jgi:hypothetical protein
MDNAAQAGMPLPKFAFHLPPGQWPGGTGESPVPPRKLACKKSRKKSKKKATFSLDMA